MIDWDLLAAMSLWIFSSFPRNTDSAEKRRRPASCLVNINGPEEENDKAFSRPLLAESRSYFNFYINEQDQGQRTQTGVQAQQGGCNRPGDISSAAMDEVEEEDEDGGRLSLNGLKEETKTDRECAFLSHFNIPNFVNLEHSSSLGDDDLLYEPSVILERKRDPYCDIH